MEFDRATLAGAPEHYLLKWTELNQQIVACRRCPRLVKHCQHIAKVKRKAYAEHEYWGQPVPNLGARRASLVIVGLAPGAHGANRTGRMFTGDRSGDWLYRALHKAGFANQPQSIDIDDGLRLNDCLITAACHCAPPDNKPTTDELQACSEWFQLTLEMTKPKVLVALGQIGWNAIFRFAKQQGWHQGARPKFGHAAEQVVKDKWTVIGCYHPSQQNTFTGRLTEKMLDDVFKKAQKLIA